MMCFQEKTARKAQNYQIFPAGEELRAARCTHNLTHNAWNSFQRLLRTFSIPKIIEFRRTYQLKRALKMLQNKYNIVDTVPRFAV
jgi:hypothetical protein